MLVAFDVIVLLLMLVIEDAMLEPVRLEDLLVVVGATSPTPTQYETPIWISQESLTADFQASNCFRVMPKFCVIDQQESPLTTSYH